MAQIKCEYCGTLFDPDQGICPLCGIPEEEGMYTSYTTPTPVAPVAPVAPRTPMPAEPKRPMRKADMEIQRAAERSARSSRKQKSKKNEDKVPAWIGVTICGVLTIAVVLGGGIALLQTGVFQASEELEEVLSLPYASEDETTGDVLVEEEPQIQVDTNVACNSLSLNYSEVTLFEAGEQLTLVANTDPAEAAENVAWISGDDSICTVSSTGVVTAISGGSTTVTAVCGEQMATSQIRCGFESATTDEETGETVTTTDTVVDETNFTASLNLSDFTLFDAGETAQLVVNGAPSSVDVTWKIANEAVATVSDSGLVTGLKTGTTKVTCTVGDQILECYVRCNMINSTVAGGETSTGGTTSTTATLSHTDVTIAVGESFTISVQGSTAAHTFTSSNGGVCLVDASGKVTGTGSGTANVTTEVNGETMTCVVRIN